MWFANSSKAETSKPDQPRGSASLGLAWQQFSTLLEIICKSLRCRRSLGVQLAESITLDLDINLHRQR
jgi:hypothetical protein